MAYGIAGRREAVPPREARAIVEAAARLNIGLIDTAPAYGDIEARLDGYLGKSTFHVVTKIPAVPPATGNGSSAIATFVTRSMRESRSRLGARLGTILFHRGADLLGPHAEAAWDAACGEAEGAKLGASCYGPAEAVAVMRRFPVSVVQLPGNAFDQRLAQDDCAAELGRLDLHVRSVFLQGLLLMPREAACGRVPRAAAALAAWSRWLADHDMTPLRAALGVAKALPGVRYCVVGVDSRSQLEEIADAWNETDPIQAPSLAVTDEDVIDPRRWSRQA